MELFQEPKSRRDIYVERRWYGLGAAHALRPFELVQSTSEGSLQIGLAPQE